MLPFDLPWYRRLLAFAFAFGIAGGAFGLVYLGATGAATDAIFGDAGTALWSGEWWWIPLIAAGALVVVALRDLWSVPTRVPGGVEIIESAQVDYRTVFKWVAIAAISAVAGASLGPSFALVIFGGGLGSWVAERRWAEGRADQDYTLTGIAGAFGAAFTSPILGAFLVSELGPTPRARYVASIIPQVIASSVGFVLFYSIVGRTFLDSYELPPYEFAMGDMVTAMGLGVLAAIVMVVFVMVMRVVNWVSGLVANRYAFGIIGGAGVGLIAVAFPLTLGAGQSQLGTVIDDPAALGIGLLMGVIGAKMVAMALSLAVGFMGGNVFPMIFVGGTAGVVVNLIFPDIPAALAVASMLAAVPGSYIRAPISMTFIAVIGVGLEPEGVAPVIIAVVTAYLVVAALQYTIATIRTTDTPR